MIICFLFSCEIVNYYTRMRGRGKLPRNMTYHIDNANKLEVKHDCNRSRLVDNRARVLVVVFEQVFVKSRLICFHGGFCKAKNGKIERKTEIDLEGC